jgi:HEAT repeat protein
MRNSAEKLVRFLGLNGLLLLLLLSGCAEGPFYQLGALNPWVRKKWADEEKIAQTFIGRRKQLRDLAKQARSMAPAEHERVSQELATLLKDDPVTVLRIEAVHALAAFPTSTASTAIRSALSDNEAAVRIAACEALGVRREPDAVGTLQQVLGSDSDIDVRLMAAESLAAYPGPDAVRALGIAIEDPDPALQFRAMQSLREVSDKDYGYDLVAWRQHVRGERVIGSNENPSLVELLRKWF